MRLHSHTPHSTSWKRNLFRIIFEFDTPGGKAFDVALIASIVLSVVVVMLDSVEAIQQQYHGILYVLEWGFTLIFTAEYMARLICVNKPWRYARSPFGLVDLLAVLPTYLSLFFAGAQSLLVIRALRLLRVFRVFKLTPYLFEADALKDALQASRRKIVVFLVFVLSVAVIMGALMYWIEGEKAGFTSIPRGMYWAIVTMTTVGYGDIAPRTVPGQMLAGALMILGYGIIAVPTGIVSAELARAPRRIRNPGITCPDCAAQDHDLDAAFCKACGAKL